MEQEVWEAPPLYYILLKYKIQYYIINIDTSLW